VALHGAALPQREQPMFEHLASIVTPLGFGVLTFDRRECGGDDDTPLQLQADDALSAVRLLGSMVEAPVGLFGFSQGAWAASLAASQDSSVGFLAVVGCSGVSPAMQMRFYTDELLRRAGYSKAQRAQLRALRMAIEELLRGEGDRHEAAALLLSARDEPWFDLAYLPPELPAPGDRWDDIDYDPEPAFTNVHCPTLLLYGEDEECVPAEESKRVWLRAASASRNSDVTIFDIPGCGHFPAPDAADELSLQLPLSAFSTAYTAALRDWFSNRRPT
jgi:uncharacterized protein